jgi:quercetin dioxygenase-like cupin family protein
MSSSTYAQPPESIRGDAVAIIRTSDIEARHPRPGWDSRFFHSDHMTFAYTEVAAGADVQEHRHEQEEVFFVIEGDLEVRIGDQVTLVHAGDAAVVPSGEAHAVRAVTASRLLVVDHPPRDSVGGVSTGR